MKTTLTTLNKPKGTRFTTRVVAIETTCIVPDVGRSATCSYNLTDEEGFVHYWPSSHLARQPRGKAPYIPEGDGALYITATIDGTWGWPNPHGYILVRGRFWRDNESGAVEPVAVTSRAW